MNIRALAAWPLVLPLFSTARPAPADEILFDAREGLTLTKTFTSTSERERRSDSERGSSSSTSKSSYSLAVTDTVKEAADGRVLVLEREFDDIAAETESSFDTGGRYEELSSTASSELDAETVTFTWDADEEVYVATSDDVDDDVLEKLVYDYDFTALLPGEEVAEDDEWEIEPEVFEALMSPWGALALEWESSSDGGDLSRSTGDTEVAEPEVEESEDGEVSATYEGLREVDGVELAVIRVVGEIESERTMDHSQAFGNDGSSTTHQETVETRTVEGEILWDVEGGHLRSIELELEVEGTENMENSITFGDREFNNDSETEISGTSTFSVLFEAQ